MLQVLGRFTLSPPVEEVMSEFGSYPLGYSEDEARRLASQAAFFEECLTP